MNHRIGICAGCGKSGYYAKPSKALCQRCNAARLVAAKDGSIKRIANKKKTVKRKATGELELFKKLNSERGNHCEKCNKFIAGFSVANFHHIKPKGRYPELRLVESNIIKICFECHFNIHNK